MGALKAAGYRSAEQYLEAAKAIHIASGNIWSEQLAQARRVAIRSCRRNLGSPKQAGGLPLPRLGDLVHLREPLAKGGPVWPVRATIVISWWLLREIEAAHALKEHVVIDRGELNCQGYLEASFLKDRPGGFRRIPCSPVRLPREQAERWADSFQEIARRLGLPLQHQNGARIYSGHTGRVTGARHMASTQIELWRVQLFGRWGSDVFKHYIQDSPVAQLDSLALETGARLSIEEAKLQLQDLLRRTASETSQPIATPPAEMLRDCETAVESVSPHGEPREWIQNSNPGGKLHRPLDCDPGLHPREWRTCCGWRFGLATTDYKWISRNEAGSGLTSPEATKWTRELQSAINVQNARADTPVHIYMVSQNIQMLDVEEGVFGRVPNLIIFSLVGCLVMIGLIFKSVMIAVRGLVTIVFTLAIDPNDFRGVSEVPVTTFTIVLGLALDYDIFLLGRMTELRERGLPTLDSVADGVAQTGLMMAIAFGGMLLSDVPGMRQLSFIFTLGVLIDTFVVRTIVTPALTAALGEANWRRISEAGEQIGKNSQLIDGTKLPTIQTARGTQASPKVATPPMSRPGTGDE
eukprot:s1791_g17.t1